MSLPKVVTREQWLRARRALLAEEKLATRARDRLNEARRRLPMVLIDKEYGFDGPVRGARASLRELFAGRRQLVVAHVMFFAESGVACRGCSFAVDQLPHLSHLHARDTTVVLASRAPLEQLLCFRERMGWTVPWYSSAGSDFNYDFHVTTDERVRPVEYNYRTREELERLGLVHHTRGEQPGVSVFLRDGPDVFHTYSTYARGLEVLQTSYQILDLTPFGRGEGWGGMPDLNGLGRGWLRHHDRYEDLD